MAWTPITGTAFQYSNDSNELAVDYYLKFYDSGTTTPYSMATDSTGGTLLAKCKISAEGYPITNPLDDTTVFIPHVDQNYRAVLYRNETDADNNTTANAAWNIDGIAPDIAALATSADISMKGTTLQVQDDYDRSPLFVDGTDFTAGAGPHVITVPAAWTPSNSDMRFYKLDNSGIVTTLTPTLTDATTFTLAETLLSTDTIFIGDDTFRNQNDGDPADIRTRLDVYDTSTIDTADNLRLEKANDLSDVASVVTARENLGIEAQTIFTGDKTLITKADLTGGEWLSGLMNVYFASAAAAPITSINSVFFVPGDTLVGRGATYVNAYWFSSGTAQLIYTLSPGAENLAVKLYTSAGVFVSDAYIRKITSIPCIGL